MVVHELGLGNLHCQLRNLDPGLWTSFWMSIPAWVELEIAKSFKHPATSKQLYCPINKVTRYAGRIE